MEHILTNGDRSRQHAPLPQPRPPYFDTELPNLITLSDMHLCNDYIYKLLIGCNKGTAIEYTKK